jgi:hypothetical protein
MRQSYNRERAMPIILEVTFEELRQIESLAKAVMGQEEMPDGIWKSELRDLLEGVQGAIKEAARDAAGHFNSIVEND